MAQKMGCSTAGSNKINVSRPVFKNIHNFEFIWIRCFIENSSKNSWFDDFEYQKSLSKRFYMIFRSQSVGDWTVFDNKIVKMTVLLNFIVNSSFVDRSLPLTPQGNNFVMIYCDGFTQCLSWECASWNIVKKFWTEMPSKWTDPTSKLKKRRKSNLLRFFIVKI